MSSPDELGFGGFVVSDNNANSQFAGAATDDDHPTDRPEWEIDPA